MVSVTEFASRLLSGNSLSARLRPKEYRRFPESTLNATLEDIHDFVQYAVVQAQRIIFGQDLDKTFAVGFFFPIFVSPFFLKFGSIITGLKLGLMKPTGFPWLYCLILAYQDRTSLLVDRDGPDFNLRRSPRLFSAGP